MARSSSRTDGVKFQVKLSMRTSGWILRWARERQVPSSDVVRELVDDRLFLFGVPHTHYVRMVAAAAKQRLPLAEYLKGVLVAHADGLPDTASQVSVPTQLLDEAGSPARRTKR